MIPRRQKSAFGRHPEERSDEGSLFDVKSKRGEKSGSAELRLVDQAVVNCV
jgi:hypothetical protein